MNTPHGVKPTLTGKPRTAVENREFAAFTRRILRAYSRRVASGDIEALPELIDLAASLADAIDDAVIGLREFGYSWAEVASRLGISKQAVHERWGPTSNLRKTYGRATKAQMVLQDPLFDPDFEIGACP